MNNHSNTQNDDVLLRYMNFVENSVPIIRECMEYISVSERHLYEAVTRNTNERYYTNTYRESPMRPPLNSRRRERSPSYDYNNDRQENSNNNSSNTRQHNINNNRLRNRNGNDVLNNISPLFTNSNSETHRQNDNPNNLLNYMNSLQNIMGSGQNNANTNFLANIIPHLTPVMVRPTQNQISIACETVEFGTIENPPNSNCPITIEPFNSEDIVTRIKYCGHCFKTEALNRWFTNNVRCPMCRYDIRTYINNQNFNNMSTNEEPTSLEPPSTGPTLSETPQMDPSVNILYTTVQYYSTLPNENEDENQENNQADNS
jgi:hypothetical protein